ncbi:exopolyphosphatase/guanosine-5'-triphosphate,3'-diphosphate pyrophosphatase [Lewinella aquimaris]|uniref:Exopolyphosphatase/guanosine-5'-triphosphate, 3'-diphosphate pyrophosphatase n=1 Tax=Neolewinella aquimaris TaxID=1835722 RepID=A0A840E0I3_9BACT|nr:exopolyphosphatase [Neolewinella aquimaris]MBB4077453.1 exopolyphosphatase/guanosine-5'-triphosphate,3'-diphosphate pyrophosphatase [Neolewinella aquimaris]
MAENSLHAVIDLGTNTFHLLIAEVRAEEQFAEIYRERIFVKLASDGIETIGPEPFARGIATLKHFARVIREHGVTSVTAIGTAALRTATNGEAFVRTASLECGIEIGLISGDTEAELITRGVLAALPPLEDRVLIMDIGGGSTEYIIASSEGVHWRQSFPIGVAVLQRSFHHTDPISADEVSRLENFLEVQLQPLREALGAYPAHHLVGAAGTFDVMAEVLRDGAALRARNSHVLTMDGLEHLHLTIVGSTVAERLAIPGVPPERVDLIVVAMLLIRFTIGLAGIRKLTVSDYAMKEGILLNASDQNLGSPAASG